MALLVDRRQFALGALVLSLGEAAPARAQGHWLIGTWVGKTENVRAYGDSSRTLVVTSVSADGTTAIGMFDAGGLKSRPRINVAGDKVMFVLGTVTTGATIALTRRGNELVGTRTDNATGQATNIKLVRQ